MKKLFESLKKIIKWRRPSVPTHFLVCYALMLTLTPIIGIWWTLLATILAALGKEAFDFFIQRDNDKNAVLHDLICDGCGILVALITMLIWKL